MKVTFQPFPAANRKTLAGWYLVYAAETYVGTARKVMNGRQEGWWTGMTPRGDRVSTYKTRKDVVQALLSAATSSEAA